MSSTPTPEKRKHSHYFKAVGHLDEIYVYRVCDIFQIDDPSGATQHALKKLLLPGQRGGGKDRRKDIQEAIDTLRRKLEMMDEDAQLTQPMHVGVDPGADDDMTVMSVVDLIPGMYSAIQDALRYGTGIAVINPMDIFKPQGGDAGTMKLDPTPVVDPHAELRKTWAPDQRWQFRGKKAAGDWSNVVGVPLWDAGVEYRRHPDDIDPPKPWYPDENTDWVDVSTDLCAKPQELQDDDLVEFLYLGERVKKSYRKSTWKASNLDWTQSPGAFFRIVAYRIIKNGKKND